MSDSPASDESGLRQVLDAILDTGAEADEEEEEVEEVDSDKAPAPQPEAPAPLTQQGPQRGRPPPRGPVNRPGPKWTRPGG